MALDDIPAGANEPSIVSRFLAAHDLSPHTRPAGWVGKANELEDEDASV